MNLSYPLWLEELVKRTENYTLYEAYDILSSVLEDRLYTREELEIMGIEAEKDFSKEELILFLLTNSNFYVFI